jgi:hypothetical protein
VTVFKAFKASDSSWETMFLKKVGVQQIFFCVDGQYFAQNIVHIGEHCNSCFDSLAWLLSSQLSIPAFQAIWGGGRGEGEGGVEGVTIH